MPPSFLRSVPLPRHMVCVMWRSYGDSTKYGGHAPEQSRAQCAASSAWQAPQRSRVELPLGTPAQSAHVELSPVQTPHASRAAGPLATGPSALPQSQSPMVSYYLEGCVEGRMETLRWGACLRGSPSSRRPAASSLAMGRSGHFEARRLILFCTEITDEI